MNRNEIAGMLAAHNCYEMLAVQVHLGKAEYEGVLYKQDQTDVNSGEKYTVEAYFLGGELTKQNRARTAFPLSGEDWYVVCHTAPKKPQHEKYFILRKWSVPDGAAIDHYEEKPYRRVTMTVTPLEFSDDPFDRSRFCECGHLFDITLAARTDEPGECICPKCGKVVV